MAIVLKSDFVGAYFISQTLYDSLDTFIEKFEKQYLLQMLGAELYKLFIADLNTATPRVPLTQIYLDIFNEFLVDNDTNVIASDGIRKMLIQFIYFEYIRETQLKNTANGTVQNAAELGVMRSWENNIVTSYNEGVTNTRAIQWYICENETSYPTYNGQQIKNIGIL